MAGVFKEKNELPSKKFQENSENNLFQQDPSFGEDENTNIIQSEIFNLMDDEPDPDGGSGNVTGEGGGVGTRPLAVPDSLYFLLLSACIYILYIKRIRIMKKK